MTTSSLGSLIYLSLVINQNFCLCKSRVSWVDIKYQASMWNTKWGSGNWNAEYGNACQDNNSKPLSELFARKRRRVQWANQRGRVSCTFLFNFLTQNGFRIESTRNYRGKRKNDLIRGCRSACQERKRVTPFYVFFPSSICGKTNKAYIKHRTLFLKCQNCGFEMRKKEKKSGDSLYTHVECRNISCVHTYTKQFQISL